jgi:hypothetical protein
MFADSDSLSSNVKEAQLPGSIFVGNLDFRLTEADVLCVFEQVHENKHLSAC